MKYINSVQELIETPGKFFATTNEHFWRTRSDSDIVSFDGISSKLLTTGDHQFKVIHHPRSKKHRYTIIRLA